MLMLWFPELMNRFRYYETLYDGERNKTTMCEIVSLYKAIPEEMTEKCNDTINESVYINIVIIGIACIPTSLIVPLFVNKLGLRFFLGSRTMPKRELSSTKHDAHKTRSPYDKPTGLCGNIQKKNRIPADSRGLSYRFHYSRVSFDLHRVRVV